MAQLINIGNSKGIRIPKQVIEQACLADSELELTVVDGGLLITPNRHPRAGWAEAIDLALSKHNDDTIDHEWLDAPLIDHTDLEW